MHWLKWMKMWLAKHKDWTQDLQLILNGGISNTD